MIKRILIISLLLGLSATMGYAVSKEDMAKNLAYHEKIMNSEDVRVIEFPRIIMGKRDSVDGDIVATINFELRFGFKNERDRDKYTDNFSDSSVSTQYFYELLSDKANAYLADKGFDVVKVEMRQVVYDLTAMAIDALKDEPIYVISFQPKSIDIPTFIISRPDLLPDDEMKQGYYE